MLAKSPFAVDKHQLQQVLTDSFKGTWQGEGQEVFPTTEGQVKSCYLETLTFQDVFETTNPTRFKTRQSLICVQYISHLQHKQSNETIHQESGYWLFDVDKGQFFEAIPIPKGIAILATGVYFVNLQQNRPADILISAATTNSADLSCISEQLKGKRSNLSNKFITQIKLSGDNISYFENTIFNLQGKEVNHNNCAALTKQS